MYTLSGVTKTYRKRGSILAAVQNVDLSIAGGEWLAIQGRTGSGKTTLLQLLGAMQRPDGGGVVSFDGRDLAMLPETGLAKVRAAAIGFVFQTFNLIPTLSAAENVEAALVPQRRSAADRRARVATALDSVGLGDRAHHSAFRRAVRRTAATGRHRPRAGQTAEGPARRRTHRQPRHRHPR